MNRTTILIVEDEGIVAENLAGKLDRLGYGIAGTVANGEEAVALTGSLRPTVVLMDIWLKGPMDGIAAAEAIRRQYDVPVIYLTAHSDAATLSRAKVTGPFGYILKPFEERELAAQIELALHKHQADRQVREQREWLRVTLTSIGDAVIATDAAGQVSFLNPVAETLTGWKSEEAVGQSLQSVFRIINEQTGHPLQDPVVRVLKEGHPVALANHAALVTKDGRTVPVEDSAAPILDATGQLIGAVLVFHDVTQKRRAEEALRGSEERLRLLVEGVKDYAIFMFDAQGRVATWNTGAERLKGYAAKEILGEHFSRFYTSEDIAAGKPERELTIAREQGSYAEEGWRIRKDGSRFWAAVAITALRDESGRLRGFSKITRDMSERRAMEEKLESVAKFPAENPYPVLRIGSDGQVLYANKPAEELLEREGWKRDGMAPPIVREPARSALTAGRPFESEIICRDQRNLLLLCIPVADTGYVNIYVRDVTDTRQAEEALVAAKASAERAKAAAEQANRAKDHFLAVLSHELRTPLTPVVMGVSMLQDRPDLDPRVHETLEMIRRNVEMEARLIDDLLDVMRIARGKVELNRSPVALGTIINRAVEVCKPDIEARRLEFGVDMGQDASYWVEADVARLQQVLWNLLKNAIKFTPHGGCVGIRCRPDNGYVIVEVNDSGIGIEQEALGRVFNAFEQAERSITREFGGLGLGLAISKALVEMHGGTIEAHSDGRNKGARFRIRLPLAASAGQPEAPSRGARPQLVVRPLRILLVEDHGVTAKMMKAVLLAEGHAVETAGDVATALEMTDQHTFDLLLSDLGLPDGSGHDLMRELRIRGHKFPGIALSGYGQEEDIQRSRKAGFAAHLTKPASREAVVEAIASATVEKRTTNPAPAASDERKENR